MKKKYILFAALFATLGLSSCDMEKYPYNSVEESKYLKKLSDFTDARVGLYSNYRGTTTGGYILMPEIQCDDFHATAGFSNSFGNQYRWDFQTTDGNIESVWSNYYSIIARCNFFLGSYDKVVQGEITGFSEDDLKELNSYASEAFFTRAYAYYQLAIYYCNAYNANTADSDLGLPIQLIYNPTSNSATYPGRSSLKATYEQILADLSAAKERAGTIIPFNSKAKNALYYMKADVITALRARIALQMGDYDTAISASTQLITSGKYPLAQGFENFRGLWKNDTGIETIWQIYMEYPNELGSATGNTFRGQYIPDDPSKQIMDYIPSQALIDLYDKDNDMRFKAYFEQMTVKVSTGASGTIYVFDKYPGNPTLGIKVDDHYTNMSKPFRIAEQYLIAAEAYAMKNDMSTSAKYLNDLRRNRITGYTDEVYNNPNTLLSDIQDERHKELVGEGFRLGDLKRWGLGINRLDATQNESLVLQPGSVTTTALTKLANDIRFTWPIPKSEMDVNPQLKEQQNIGY